MILQSDVLNGNYLRAAEVTEFSCRDEEKGYLFPGAVNSAAELIYVEKGSLHSITDGRDYLLEPGDLLFCGAGQWHMEYADVDVCPRLVRISFEIAGEGEEGLLNRKITPTRQAQLLLWQMVYEWEHRDAYYCQMITHQLTLLLLTLLRQAKDRSCTAEPLSGEHEIIRKAQIYISNHCREKLSVPLAAKHADVSPSYLTALFQKNLNISPGEYIRRIKLQESRRMIREGELNFTEIAGTLQYSTVHQFSRQFKEKFGMTPSEYAKSVR